MDSCQKWKQHFPSHVKTDFVTSLSLFSAHVLNNVLYVAYASFIIIQSLSKLAATQPWDDPRRPSTSHCSTFPAWGDLASFLRTPLLAQAMAQLVVLPCLLYNMPWSCVISFPSFLSPVEHLTHLRTHVLSCFLIWRWHSLAFFPSVMMSSHVVIIRHHSHQQNGCCLVPLASLLLGWEACTAHRPHPVCTMRSCQAPDQRDDGTHISSS